MSEQRLLSVTRAKGAGAGFLYHAGWYQRLEGSVTRDRANYFRGGDLSPPALCGKHRSPRGSAADLAGQLDVTISIGVSGSL